LAQIQTTILRNLLRNEGYTRRVIPFLKNQYFEGGHRVVFDSIADFVAKYNKLPTPEALEIEMGESDRPVSPEDAGEASTILGEVGQEREPVNEDWLIDQTEKWCQDRAIYLAVMESINILDGKHKDLTKNALPDLLTDALSVSFDSAVGHDYIDDADLRYEFYHRTEERIPFDLHYMNKITKNGLPKKSLSVLLAGTNVGKSLFMCHHAASTLMLGKNVLYITMEMAEERIAERIDANLMNVPLDALEDMNYPKYTQKIESITKKGVGKLIIKNYPTGSAHAGHFRALLNELKLKRDFVPDLILVDYLNICSSSRMKMGGAVNSYTYVKAIAEELRGLAVEHDVPMMTATQSNREGFSSSDVELGQTSESFGVPATADLMFAMIRTEELDELNQVMVKQLKNRYGDPSKNRRFVLGIDTDRMKFYDVEESAQTLTGSGEDDIPVFDHSATGAKVGTHDFSGLKV